MGSYIAAVGFGCDLPDASEEVLHRQMTQDIG